MSSRFVVGIAAAFVSVAATTACGSDPASAEPLASVELPIFGGQNASTCQWPTTVLLNGCSGTLVHPSIVTTAAHCGTNHKTAIFGETQSNPARSVSIDYCRTYTGSRVPGHLSDWAFCKLKTPVTDVPIVPILMGCETDILKPGQKVVVAGFGANATPPNDGFGTKRWVETTINQEDTGRGIQVGGMGKAPCFGDSGGPAFVQLADGSWRVFGIDSSGLSSDCRDGDLMALIHPAVPWIEKSSGVDITPCHDADGTWHPSRACKSFSLAPSSEGRSWKTACHESGMSGPEATCGKALVDPGDLPDGGTDPWDDGGSGAPGEGSGGGSGATPDPGAYDGTSSDHRTDPEALGCAARVSARPSTPTSFALLAIAWAALSATRRSRRRSSGSAARDR
jgi:Trypsin